MVSLAIYERASNSASVEEVVTVSYLLALHATGPPNNFIMNPWELLRSILLSANDVSLAHTREEAVDWWPY